MGDGNCRRQFFDVKFKNWFYVGVAAKGDCYAEHARMWRMVLAHSSVCFPIFSFSFFSLLAVVALVLLVSRLWCLLFSRHRRLGFPQHMWSSMPCSFETSSERLGQSQVGTNRGGCSVKADQRLEMIQLPRFGSRHFSCFASCWQGSKWADVPHFAALCCGYPEVRGGTSGIEKGGYLDLQQLRSYGILVPWHFITCLRRSKTQACWYFKALELFEIIGCTWWMSYKWRYGYAHFGIISFSILKDFCGKNLSCHCRQELTPGVNISVKVISGDESEKQVWQWLEAGLQDLRNWSLVQLRDMMMGCVCGFETVHWLIGYYLLSGVFCWHISVTLLQSFFSWFLKKSHSQRQKTYEKKHRNGPRAAWRKVEKSGACWNGWKWNLEWIL